MRDNSFHIEQTIKKYVHKFAKKNEAVANHSYHANKPH